ncbi:sugar phosphate nucleotidyltransferase [Xenorhabdus bovienii]|uniref:sugar phosphate nucleotidyltransferase n=1 Tax=Xenorhabdus bovienii TaxID=40576 RepID=UPI003DA5A8EC
MNFIFTIAGKGIRFLNEGIHTPKFLLKLNDSRTILNHILSDCIFPEYSNLYFLFHRKYKNVENEIFQDISLLPEHVNVSISFCDDTSGQAETVWLASQQIENNAAIVIMNNDTILRDRNFYLLRKKLSEGRSCYVDIFEPDEKINALSYVKQQNSIISDIQEKIVVSDFASSGLYGFSSANLYQELYCTTHFERQEKYISYVIKQALEKNIKVFSHCIHDETDTLILGTPLQYHAYMKRTLA